MKRLLLLVAFVAVGIGAAVAQDYKSYDDVIYATDGTVVRGTIIEQVPGVKYKIATGEGNVFVFDALMVEKITKEPPVQNYYRSGDELRYDEYGEIITRKSPLLAGVGSFFVTGLGQIINGQTNKGLLLMGGHAASGLLMYAGSYWAEGGYMGDYSINVSLALLGLAGWVGTWLYSLIDAPIYASQWNEQNGFALGDNKWLKVAPTVGVSNTVATGTSTTFGLGATFTF